MRTSRGRATLALVGLLTALGVGSHPAAAEIQETGTASVEVEPIRSRWPVMREASGRWVVLGEGIAKHSGSEPLNIRSVRFRVLDDAGELLAQQVFEGQDLSQMLGVITYDAQGNASLKPAGTTTLGPGDVGIAVLGTLAGERSTPTKAEITFSFDAGPARKTVVPLIPFSPGQQMSWPLRFASGRPWVALNTFSPADPVPSHRIGLFLTPADFFISQRFAIDCVQMDLVGQTSNPPSSLQKEDYYAWGEEVSSVGFGQVVAVVTDQPDQEVGVADPGHPAGNYIVVQHGPRLYGLYAHMMEGSAIVSVGDRVSGGQALGRVGNSGDTTEPHLHFHFADRWDGLDPVQSIFTSQGVPALFWNAHVTRGHRHFPLHGTTPLEWDLVEP